MIVSDVFSLSGCEALFARLSEECFSPSATSCGVGRRDRDWPEDGAEGMRPKLDRGEKAERLDFATKVKGVEDPEAGAGRSVFGRSVGGGEDL